VIVATAPPVEIEKDLVRWSQARWTTVVIGIFAAQATFLILTGEPPIHPRSANPKEPILSFASETAVPSGEFPLDNPTLFAGANQRGFSGNAWMRRVPRIISTGDRLLPRVSFLALADAGPLHSSEPKADLPTFHHGRSNPEPSLAALSTLISQVHSKLRVEDLSPAELLSIPALPEQFATDAVGSTVVQILVDTEGAVFSARVWSSSGSKSADNDALHLARKARFQRRTDASAGPGVMASGKLIFDWHSLSPGTTNAVPR
jgi:TonB family protein